MPLMASIRQEKIAQLLQQELGIYFQREARTVCKGAMVSVTVVRISPDMSIARAYLSVFGAQNKVEILESIESNTPKIKHHIAKNVRFQLRKMPDLEFFLDDSIDYAMEIDSLLKKK